ncbi:hypothetical protein [Hymenobacter guriensis]|uniref:Uncharacterized protein n=1 Tax=Hymenobacter guriensis TaxID=2793065 RepID=A0ABS0L7Q3_9BACT|nr:hypothetical protein [Hymenobacter guriensis]MBG8556180.1 hypothetical protein [Hymenobacter guriensis]
MSEIREILPQGNLYQGRVCDFHPPVAPERYAQEVREGYSRRHMAIKEAAAQGRLIGVNFMHFEYAPNAERAMHTRYAEGVNLYPQYPFLHLFLTLACPWRKLAVLVEEEETPWTPQQIQDEDELLTLNGWRVYRLPGHAARTFQKDVLPDHISYGLENGWQADGEAEEWEKLQPQMRRVTIDGFFKWLRKEHFSQGALKWYRNRDRQLVSSYIARNQFVLTSDEITAGTAHDFEGDHLDFGPVP